MLGNLGSFLPAAENKLFKKKFRGTFGMLNSSGPDQAKCFVEPDLGPKCFQRYQQRVVAF